MTVCGGCICNPPKISLACFGPRKSTRHVTVNLLKYSDIYLIYFYYLLLLFFEFCGLGVGLSLCSDALDTNGIKQTRTMRKLKLKAGSVSSSNIHLLSLCLSWFVCSHFTFFCRGETEKKEQTNPPLLNKRGEQEAVLSDQLHWHLKRQRDQMGQSKNSMKSSIFPWIHKHFETTTFFPPSLSTIKTKLQCQVTEQQLSVLFANLMSSHLHLLLHLKGWDLTVFPPRRTWPQENKDQSVVMFEHPPKCSGEGAPL